MSTVIVNQFADPKASAAQPPVQTQGQAGDAPDYGKNNVNLPDEMVQALKGLLKHYGVEVDKFPRRREVIDARRQRFYDAGNQYIYFNSSSYVFIPVVAGASVNIEGQAVQMPRYTNVYEIYKPYRRNFSAPLVQNPPGVNFKPADPSKAADITKAQNAEKYIEHVKTVNPQKTLRAKVARLYWTDGRVCAETYHEKNTQKWGRDEQGNERGEEITKIHGVLEAKCIPITATDQDDLVAVIISDDPEINMAKSDYSDYPEAAEKIKPGPSGTGESAFERNARLGVLQGTRMWAQTADAFAHLTVRHRVYLRPAAFLEAPEAVRDQLKQTFSKGCFFEIVGEAYCGSRNVSLDDALKISHALDGDGMSRPSWGKLMVTVQDAYNNYKNMRQEYHDYGIPVTYYDTAFLDPDAMQEQISQPGNHVGGENPQPGQPLENYFYTTTALSPPADLIQAEQDLRDAYSQFATGVQPALFGANVGNTQDQKVGVYAMAREQAMGVMALPWGSMQELFAGIYRNSVVAAVAERDGNEKVKIEVPGKKGRKAQTIEMTMADLQEGDFRAVPDTDSSFPESTSAKKAAFSEFMGAAAENPLLMEASLQPDTIELGKELWGVDVDIPASRAQEKTLGIIDQLLDEEPVPDEQALAAAMVMHAEQNKGVLTGEQAEETPLPEQSQFLKASIDPEPDMEFHKYMWQACLNWWNSTEKDEQEKAGNVKGLQNVKLYALAQKKLADLQISAMPPMVPPVAKPGGTPAAGTGMPPPAAGAPGASSAPGAGAASVM